MSALADRALARRVLDDAGAGERPELDEHPIKGLIAFARELVGVPGRERDLAVMFDTIESLLDRMIDEIPDDRIGLKVVSVVNKIRPAASRSLRVAPLSYGSRVRPDSDAGGTVGRRLEP